MHGPWFFFPVLALSVLLQHTPSLVDVLYLCLQEDNYTKIIAPPGRPSTGFLYFGHTGNHYIALKKCDPPCIVISEVTLH